jgi:hypothetical protein
MRETQHMFSALEISSGNLGLEWQASRARDIVASTPVFNAAAMQRVDRAVESATRALRQGDFELPRILGALLDAGGEAGFDHALFALIDEKHKSIRGRLAGSETGEQILEQFHFPVEHAEGPFVAALKRRTDVLVDRLRDDRYDGSSLVTRLKPSAFALFPIIVDEKAAACLYAGRLNAAPGLESMRYSLARVRDTMTAAIRRKAPAS